MSHETLPLIISGVFVSVWLLVWYIVTRVAGAERRPPLSTKRALARRFEPRPHRMPAEKVSVKQSPLES